MGRLDHKTAIITGASKGIGQAIAVAFHREGANLVLTKNRSPLDETLGKISGGTENVLELEADVSSEGSAQKVVDRCVEQFGRVDILVNNAGVHRDALLLRMKEEDWDLVMATNLRSAFTFTKAALKPMVKQQSGSIINIASVVGLMGNPGQANYAASKAGLIGFTKSVAREVGSRSIRVNVIAPGFIDTGMTQSVSQEAREKLIESIPLKTLGTGEDVAYAALYLASDESAYVTGEVLSVNGGMYM
jgi:3-oxoacyl-[acyl-carrier protein] reductase